MRNLFSRRFVALWAVLALLVFGLPGAALAAEAESPTESGWVEQETGTGGSGGGSSEVQSGSSLGSGAGAAPKPEPDPEPVETMPPPKPEPTTPQPSAEETSGEAAKAEEEATTTTEEVVPDPVVEKPEPAPLAGGTAVVGTAVAGVSAESGLEPLVATSTNAGDAAGGSSFSGSAVALIVVFALLFAGLIGFFGLRHLRQRYRWRREANEWRAAVRKLDPDERPQLKVRRAAGEGANGRPAAPTGAPPAKVH